MNIEELKSVIGESFPKYLTATELDFEGVIEDLPLRDTEGILRLLPYVMRESLFLVESEKTQKLQVLETAIRLFNGVSDCQSMQSIALRLREIMTPSQRKCMGLWLVFLKDLDVINYVEDDLDECTRFWCRN